MKHYIKASLFASILAGCSPSPISNMKEEWNKANNPVKMMADKYGYDTKLADLKTYGRPEKMPWSDNYWPTYQGGLAYRWNTADSQKLARMEANNTTDRLYRGQLDNNPELQTLRSKVYGYKPYTKEELLAMPEDERSQVIRSLSPAEKYDIYSGRFDYPVLNSERERTGIESTLRDSPSYKEGTTIETWFGICHAWAPATIVFHEPEAVAMQSKDDIKVEFGASDVKALLSYALHVDPSQARTDGFLGVRCNTDISVGNQKKLFAEIFQPLTGKSNDAVIKALGQLKNAKMVDGTGRLGLAAYAVSFSETKEFAEREFKKFAKGLYFDEAHREEFDATYIQGLKTLEIAGTDNVFTVKQVKAGITSALRSKSCTDTNAGAFHLVLANVVGRDGQSFGVDVTADFEVWNQAVASYESTITMGPKGKASAEAARGTWQEAEVVTEFYYSSEMNPAWEPFTNNSADNELKDYHNRIVYRYVLELDREGHIIGGRWLSDERPDFLWATGNLLFSSRFSDVQKIYYTAINSRP